MVDGIHCFFCPLTSPLHDRGPKILLHFSLTSLYNLCFFTFFFCYNEHYVHFDNVRKTSRGFTNLIQDMCTVVRRECVSLRLVILPQHCDIQTILSLTPQQSANFQKPEENNIFTLKKKQCKIYLFMIKKIMLRALKYHDKLLRKT